MALVQEHLREGRDALVSDLAGMDDERFRDVVDRFLRNETDHLTSEALRLPPLAERTRRALEMMNVSVGSQLDARAADVDVLEAERRGGGGLSDDQMHRFELDYARWRASALRFRGHIAEVLAGLPASRAQELEDAIRAHRAAIGDDGDEADLALWAHVGAPPGSPQGPGAPPEPPQGPPPRTGDT